MAVRRREERPGAAGCPGYHGGTSKELARNPLTLTILTFLYSLPKYRLPDNRALFYDVCTRALLEEWDQSQNPGRATGLIGPTRRNSSRGLRTRTGRSPRRMPISTRTRWACSSGSWLREMGLDTSVNVQILREIVQNAGLLVLVPPTGVRFPHQTFLEYFAALFFHRYDTVEALRAEYAGDPRGFREVVLLFCGLTESKAEVTALVDDTLRMGNVAMAVEVVANARRPPPELVDRVLSEARAAMEEEPTPELAENLGLIARNRLSPSRTRRGESSLRRSTVRRTRWTRPSSRR